MNEAWDILIANQANWDVVGRAIKILTERAKNPRQEWLFKPFKTHTGLRKVNTSPSIYMTLYLSSIYNNQFYVHSYECQSIYMNKKQLRTYMPFGHTSRSGILNISSIGTIAPMKNGGFCIISELNSLERDIQHLVVKKGKSLELCCKHPNLVIRWGPFGCDCRRCGEQDVLKNKGNLV